MTASPGVTYDHDSLGNRMLKTSAGNSTAYGWDAVNRMTSIGPSSSAKTQYSYRADGMRVKKVLPGGDVTRSYYDGQMPVEEDSVVSGTSSVTRNFVGARGIEAIFTTTTSGTTTAFPLYDCHGNMVATIARSGPGFTTSNVRTYDVWGGVRTGASTGGPKGRYVANLGHVQDDESGLIYMRARYYEPESGRFISEDPARDRGNWYRNCNSNPVNYIDSTGRDAIKLLKIIAQIALFILGAILLGMWDEANSARYQAAKYAKEAQAMLNAGLDIISKVELNKFYEESRRSNALLQRGKYIRFGQGLTKLLGYLMIIKVFLMDIEFGDEQSGLDIIFGNDNN